MVKRPQPSEGKRMALSKHPRIFILCVNEIEADLLNDRDDDEVVIEFAGKVMPSTKERIYKALHNDPALRDRVLT